MNSILQNLIYLGVTPRGARFCGYLIKPWLTLKRFISHRVDKKMKLAP